MALIGTMSGIGVTGMSCKIALDSGEIAVDSDNVAPSTIADPTDAAPEPDKE